MFTDFPCILVILYFHHINYRPVKIQQIPEKTDVPFMMYEPKQQSSINLDEEPLEVPSQTQKSHSSEPVEQNLLEKS